MGWNEGFRIAEEQVVSLYNKGLLTPDVLDTLMEPFKETDCDTGGSQGLEAKDGLSFEMIVCKTMKSEEYKELLNVLGEAEPDSGEQTYRSRISDDEWDNSDEAYELFDTIWNGMWGIW